jgi:hypothetical protein
MRCTRRSTRGWSPPPGHVSESGSGARVGSFETLKAALELGDRATSWQARIPALFELRDDLVHFEGRFFEATPHPTGNSNVSQESVVFTAEAATEAVELALEVLTVAYTSPRSYHAELVKWSEGVGRTRSTSIARRGEAPSRSSHSAARLGGRRFGPPLDSM